MRHPHARRRTREERKREARRFYELRRAKKSCGADVLPPDEAEAMSSWRGCGFTLLAVVAAAAIGWVVAKVFS